ncbi:GH18240 [Drosophila grimshawi]|uniref:GH18240 n=1 Tax=Drosophila grimshawi TaxID=7222 RepID=B4JFL8_DROGR|nr:GH18240 [Drosophila grimshawi]
MAPALTAEPLNPKEKLTSIASPATGTRQSVRKLDAPTSGGSGSATVTATATAAAAATAATTTPNTTTKITTSRVTRSKEAAKRTGSPSVQQVNNNNNNNNKRKSTNNNNNHSSSSSSLSISSELKTAEVQMGLSTATTHSSSDGNAAVAVAAAAAAATTTSAAATSSSCSDSAAPAVVVAAAASEEHNNNCNKENSAAELLAHLSDFGEAITAEICLRKTLPEVSISKEQPPGGAAVTAADTPTSATEQQQILQQQLLPVADVSMSEAAEAAAVSQSEAAATTTTAATITPSPVTAPESESLQQLVGQGDEEALPDILSSAALAAQITAEITDNIEERLSQLDGSPNIVDISAATLEAGSVTLPTTPIRQQQQQQQLQLLQQPEILNSPQHSTVGRQANALLTPQSTSSSINFLKDGAANAVLEDQDIEEVLKALKTFDGNHVNPDTIDFNFFNDFTYNEEETAAVTAAAAGGGCTTTPTTTTGSGGVAGAASNVAAAAAVAVVDDSKASCSTSSNCISKPLRPWDECHAELVLQQHELVRKQDFLLRRLRKMQARHMCRHASDEVAGILEWSARTSNKSANVAAPTAHSSVKLTPQAAAVLSTVTGRPDSSFWEELSKRPLPASQMSNVLRHIETAARKQQICHTIGGGSASLASSSSWYSSAAQPGKRPRKTTTQPMLDAANRSSTAVGAEAISTASTIMPRTDEIVPNFDSYVTSELTHVSGLLHTEMREVQNAIDSDATESSSGGESADEMVNYNNSQQLSLPITQRAVWRYSRDRANIALRWSWLCTQVSDLDMKIRQHNDVYNDLCRSEGKVLLESTPAPKNGYKDQQQQQLQLQQQQQLQSLPMDGDQQATSAGDHLCSRARPLMLSEFRKRKLFQTTNMHTISKKAARPSNIKCGCQWPQVPCTLCTGRPDPTAPRDLPETLMPQIRVALLDPGYHPVLSFSNDVCQSVHLEAISRQPDWQYRVMRSQAKAIVRGVWKAEREAIASNGGGAGAGGRRNGGTGEPVKRRAYVRRKERNNNNKNNNSNRSNSKETSTSTTKTTIQNNNNNINNNNNNNNHSMSSSSRGGGGGIVGLVDSGNGTGTATTSTSSTTPTTTPLGANIAFPLSDSSQQQQQQQQLNRNSSLISSNGNSNNKKPRKSKTSNTQQTHSINNNSNINNNNHKKINNNNSSSSGSNSRQASVGDNSNSRFTSDSQWEQQQQQQQNSRRSSAETHGQRTKDRRSRPKYDIDNIVIPHSMAAQNRIELLPYKEIPTPKWRIVDSDNEKKLQSESPSKQSTKKLSNGCAEGQAATNPPPATLPPKTAEANSQTPAETLTPTTTATTQNAAKPNNNTEMKEASKINGIKQSSKKNKKKQKPKPKDLPEPVNQPAKAEQPLSNGLINGKPEQKEQLQQQQQPTKPPLTTTLNGKTKKHKIKKNPVNNVNVNVNKANAASTATAPAPASTLAAPPASKDTKKEVAAEILEPPSKRPKLQLGATKLNSADDDEPVEDITDEAYIMRHQRALIEERRRFETLLKFPDSKRSRSNRRVDSRAGSSGANTPDPASPAAASHLAGPLAADNENIPSPLAQTMLHHALHPLDTIAADSVLTATAATKRQERRRTTSSKLKDHDRRSATPDVRDLQFTLEPPPFEPLHFPLAEEVNERLLAQMNAQLQEPQATTTIATTAVKRSKSKSVSSSNGGDGHSNNAGSRRSSKAKATNISKLAQTGATATTMAQLNGGQRPQLAAAPHINGDDDALGYDDGIDYAPEDEGEVDDEEEEEEEEMLLEEDDDHHHHLAPPEDDNQPASMAVETSLYNASIDAYIGEAGWLDEEELADDPFMDDDPNDPEWKRSIGVRIRKRM